MRPRVVGMDLTPPSIILYSRKADVRLRVLESDAVPDVEGCHAERGHAPRDLRVIPSPRLSRTFLWSCQDRRQNAIHAISTPGITVRCPDRPPCDAESNPSSLFGIT